MHILPSYLQATLLFWLVYIKISSKKIIPCTFNALKNAFWALMKGAVLKRVMLFMG